MSRKKGSLLITYIMPLTIYPDAIDYYNALDLTVLNKKYRLLQLLSRGIISMGHFCLFWNLLIYFIRFTKKKILAKFDQWKGNSRDSCKIINMVFGGKNLSFKCIFEGLRQ